ncbi:MAG: hypothetical protein J7M25_08885 [Deltaproteobacteria bacterium]|nr:hypothetical protein [Deltaproteobacteria bacterium]
MKRLVAGLWLLGLMVVFPSGAFAHDLTDVATMLRPKNPYDARLSVGFRSTWKTASLNREYMGNNKGIEVVKDLRFKQVKMELDVRGEFAIFKDLALYVSLPIILSQQSTYSFASGNRYPGYSGEENCRKDHADDPSVCNPDGVNVNNSRTVRDGIAAGLPGTGISYDPTGPSVGLDGAWAVPMDGSAGPRTLFKGPKRAGLDQLHFGLRWLVYGFNQDVNPVMPNWLIGAEFRLSVGKVMDFKRNAAGDPEGCDAYSTNDWNCRPQLNKAVSRGVHELRFYTTMSKRVGPTDSFIEISFKMPFAYRSGSFYSSKYDFSGGWGEDNTSVVNKAPKVAGIRFGTEIVAWKRPADHFRLAISVLGLIKYRFQGRDYSEAYELLAGSPVMNMNCDSPSALYSAMCGDTGIRKAMTYYPGVTMVQDYAIFGGQLGIDFLIYKYIKLQVSYGFAHQQEHFVTMTDAGQDSGTVQAGNDGCQSGQACADGRVNIPSREQNPWHRPVVDTPGHRYRVQETLIHQLWVNLQARF